MRPWWYWICQEICCVDMVCGWTASNVDACCWRVVVGMGVLIHGIEHNIFRNGVAVETITTTVRTVNKGLESVLYGE